MYMFLIISYTSVYIHVEIDPSEQTGSLGPTSRPRRPRMAAKRWPFDFQAESLCSASATGRQVAGGLLTWAGLTMAVEDLRVPEF